MSNLLAKKEKYTLLRQQLEVETGAQEIEAKVEEYRKQLQAEYDSDKLKKLDKVDAYLELINELISEENEPVLDEINTEV